MLLLHKEEVFCLMLPSELSGGQKTCYKHTYSRSRVRKDGFWSIVLEKLSTFGIMPWCYMRNTVPIFCGKTQQSPWAQNSVWFCKQKESLMIRSYFKITNVILGFIFFLKYKLRKDSTVKSAFHNLILLMSTKMKLPSHWLFLFWGKILQPSRTSKTESFH